MLPVFLFTTGLVAIALTIMSIGVIFKRKPIQGSCGGVGDSCEYCENGEKNPDCTNK